MDNNLWYIYLTAFIFNFKLWRLHDYIRIIFKYYSLRSRYMITYMHSILFFWVWILISYFHMEDTKTILISYSWSVLKSMMSYCKSNSQKSMKKNSFVSVFKSIGINWTQSKQYDQLYFSDIYILEVHNLSCEKIFFKFITSWSKYENLILYKMLQTVISWKTILKYFTCYKINLQWAIIVYFTLKLYNNPRKFLIIIHYFM